MRKTAFGGIATVAISLIALLLLASSCSSPSKSTSSPTAATAWSTPTQITSPEPNSNGAMARANVHGTGVFVTQGVWQLTGLKWKFDTTGRISATTPTVQGSTVYFGQGDTFYAIDTQTGKQRWNHAVDGQGTSAPAIAGDTVYASGWEQLFALSIDTGAVKWIFEPEKGSGDGFYSDPLVEDGTVYFAGWDSLYALDSGTGKVQWKLKLSGITTSGPTLYDRTIYISTSSPDFRDDTYLYALDSKTGQENWKFKLTRDGTGGAVAVTDGIVYVGTFQEGLVALDATSGQEKWRFTIKSGITTAPAVAYGMVYITKTGSLYAIDTQTGKEVWHHSGSADVTSDPVIADGIVYFGTTTADPGVFFGSKPKGELHAIDAQSGQELWTFGIEGGISGAPAVSDGTIYIGTDVGTLYAVK